MRAAAALALGALAACGGANGTYELTLTTAPGSTVLDRITRARLTLSVPYRQVEATRGDDGRFQLSLEVPADGPSGFVTFEGLDDAGAVIGWGRSAALPIAAVDARIAIYVAPPQSLAAAPAGLDPPRTELGVGSFSFGAIFIGGADGAGVPVDDVAVYDVYRHQVLIGDPLPAPRAGVAVGTGASGYAYAFGGRGTDGAAAGNLWRFDTTVEPRGLWDPLDNEADLARAGATTAEVGDELFLVTGDPAAVIDGRSLTVSRAATLPTLAGTASAIEDAELVYAVFVGAGTGTGGLVMLRPPGVVTEQAPPTAGRTGHGAAVTADDRVVVLGGAIAGVPTMTALVVDPIAASYREAADVLTVGRIDAAIASTGEVIVVAGGRDAGGAIVADAEVLDAVSLARIATLPMVTPRTGATATVLGNGQILIAGGVDASGAPVGTLELYTPAAPSPDRLRGDADRHLRPAADPPSR